MTIKRKWLTAALLPLLLINSHTVCAKDQGKSEGPKGWQKEKHTGKKRVSEDVVPVGTWIPGWLSSGEKAQWKNGRPPGWDRGEKRGWGGGDMPPGQAKKYRGGERPLPPGWKKLSDKEKNAWKKDLDDARKRISGKARKSGNYSEELLESALISLDEGSRKGVPIGYTSNVIEKGLDRGMSGRGIESATRAMSYGVDRGADLDKLDSLILDRMDRGYSEDELTMEIYRAISER